MKQPLNPTTHIGLQVTSGHNNVAMGYNALRTATAKARNTGIKFIASQSVTSVAEDQIKSAVMAVRNAGNI